MSLKVAIQMDHVSTIDIVGDSTFVMGLEAEKRGYQLYHYTPSNLAMLNGRVIAEVQPMQLRREVGNHFTLGDAEAIDLIDMDVVLLRQDPPFDMAYITTTHLLERVHPETLVVNNPREVRNSPEKLFVTEFADLMPPTLIASDPSLIRAFRDEHQDIILKPLYGNGGAGVFHLAPGDENMNSLLEIFAERNSEPLIAQAYVEDVREGDKRIILVDGNPVGATNRVPIQGEARSNMHVGGRAEKASLAEREREICAAIGPALRERGMIFVGIDIIGGYMTEINVTSPTGLQEINDFDSVCLEADIWDAIEAKI
mgnify:CR=1 FL=1